MIKRGREGEERGREGGGGEGAKIKLATVYIA